MIIHLHFLTTVLNMSFLVEYEYGTADVMKTTVYTISINVRYLMHHK